MGGSSSNLETRASVNINTQQQITKLMSEINRIKNNTDLINSNITLIDKNTNSIQTNTSSIQTNTKSIDNNSAVLKSGRTDNVTILGVVDENSITLSYQ